MSKMTSRVVALAAAVGLQTAAHAAPGYDFIKLVDHVDDNYSPRSFTCASINEAGDVAFKASRSAPDGLSFWDVIARVSRTGVITTIVEDPDKTQFQFFGNTVSINDSGQTSFGAFLSSGVFRTLGPWSRTAAGTVIRTSMISASAPSKPRSSTTPVSSSSRLSRASKG